jgi:ribosomal protein L29
MTAKDKVTAKKATRVDAKLVTDNPDLWPAQAIKLREEAVTLKRGMLNGDVQNIRAYKYKRRQLAGVLTRINMSKKAKENKL